MELSEIKGVGPKTLGYLKELNINNIEDLLTYFPTKVIVLPIIIWGFKNARLNITVYIVLFPWLHLNCNLLKFLRMYATVAVVSIMTFMAILSPL